MTRTSLSFYAHGTPRPQGSKRYLGNGRFIEASKDLKPWRATIANAVFSEWMRSSDDRSFTEPVVVRAVFYMPKPKSVKRLWPSVVPDVDKLCRALGDALSVDSSAVVDDSLIVAWDAIKVYAALPEDVGVKVYIRLATDADLERASIPVTNSL